LLLPAIQQALTEAPFLIVVASPEAAKSPWVAEELAYFLQVHSEASVVIVVTAGELAWKPSVGFQNDETSAFPILETPPFKTQVPRFVDLRWAKRGEDLSLSNAMFLDAVATIAATLKSVGKDRLVGLVVEEQRRRLRSQRINLGFRGAVGFGGPSLLLAIAVAVAAADRSLQEVAGLSMQSHLILSIGFLATGMIGALCCGTGWRGAVGFAIAMLLLLPFYFYGSLAPFNGSLVDRVFLSAISVTGFGLAGGIGALWCREITWAAGARAWAIGGFVVASLWSVFGFLSTDRLYTALVAGPWPIERLVIGFQKMGGVTGAILADAYSNGLLPLVAGATIGGLGLGSSLADSRMKSWFGARSVPVWKRLVTVKSGIPITRVAVAIAVIGLIGYGYTATDGYQSGAAREVLRAGNLRRLIAFNPDTFDPAVFGRALLLAIKTRQVIETRGEHAEVEELTLLIGEWLKVFAQEIRNFTIREGYALNQPPNIDDVASALRAASRPDEIKHLFDQARLMTRRDTPWAVSDAWAAIAVGRAERTYVSEAAARESLDIVADKLPLNDWYGRALLAQGFYELGLKERAKQTLQALTRDVSTAIEKTDVLPPPDVLDGAIEAAVDTGVWDTLPEWRRFAQASHAKVIELMCRRGDSASAISAIENSLENSFIDGRVHEFVRTAARGRHYETARAVLETLQRVARPWQDPSLGRLEGLGEIAAAALENGDEVERARAVVELRAFDRDLAKREGMHEAFGVERAKAFAQAGEYDDALNVVGELRERRWAGELAIGEALAKSGRHQRSIEMIAKAWRGFQAGRAPASDNASSTLVAIGSALANMGELWAARAVADDLASGGAARDGFERVHQTSVYLAILTHLTTQSGVNR
jgi:hypothetical protein